ncbi:hypothetical protein [Streptomyces sp. NRRL F-2580]|uniref:hypothetical protein n=1 Tax=Streptomyces sp. NRRL F-2580 TaxID=1463841 RepID=UPI0004C7C87F|nr:hypothetical protein [Streptomyces sp. NRRL F-2580]
MTDPEPWDAWADERDQEYAPYRGRQPSKAAVKRRWHQDARTELHELGELYGVSPDVANGAI